MAENSTRGDSDSEEAPDMPAFLDIERDRGILTQSDREYIMGEKELEGQAERNTRFRIRNRLEDALLDFALIDQLSEEDRSRVVDNIMESEGGLVPFHDAISFVYNAAFDMTDTHSKGIEQFEGILSGAVSGVERQRFNKIAEVRFDVDREEPDIDELLQKLVAGNGTIEEFTYYMERGGGELFQELARANKPLEVRVQSEKSTFFDEDEIQDIVDQADFS